MPHGALKQSQLLRLLHPPAHREHFWNLGSVFPSAPLMGIMAFWCQGTPMPNPLSELLLVSIFSICKTSTQDAAAAANAVPWWDTHRPAALPSLPAPGYPPPPQPPGSWTTGWSCAASTLDCPPALTGFFIFFFLKCFAAYGLLHHKRNQSSV